MRISALSALLLLVLALLTPVHGFGAEQGYDTADQMELFEDYTSVEPLDSYSIDGPEYDDEAYEAVEDEDVPESDYAAEMERARLQDYYTQEMMPISGTISSIDLEKSTITVDGGAEVVTYVFDGDTRFQVRLTPALPEDIKAGSKMVGLFRERDGLSYIGRVMVLPPVTKKARKKRRRHR